MTVIFRCDNISCNCQNSYKCFLSQSIWNV